MMDFECPLEFCHKKGEYTCACRGDFCFKGVFFFFFFFFFNVLELVELFRLYLSASLCIYIFLALDVFFDKGRYIVFVYMFLVSLLIDLYL